MPRTAITRASEAAPGTIGTVTAVLALLALWLLGHPYPGIVHDARLYTLQGLALIEPAAFDREIFFLADHQGRYTIFPAVYAEMIGLLGPGAAAMIASAIMQIAWLGAAAMLLRRLLTGASLWLALAALAVVPGDYGGFHTFAYAEPFATPRPLAEALTLAALAATVGGRLWPAVGLHGAAMIVHPVMALPGLAVTFLYRGVDDRRWWLAAAGAGAAALGMAGVAPLSGLSRTMDTAWFAVVETRTPYLLPTRWPLSDWTGVAFAAASCVVAFRFLGERARRLCLAAAGVAAGGLAASVLLGDAARNVLVLQLQPWRSLWLLHVLAHAALAPVVLHVWRQRPLVQAAVLFLAAGWLTRPFGPAALALLALAAGAALARDADVSAGTARLLRLAGAVFAALGLLGWLGIQGWSVAVLLETAWTAGAPLPLDSAAAQILPLALFALAALITLRWLPLAGTPAALGLALTAALGAGAIWDHRSPWDVYVESKRNGTGAGIDAPTGETVYWPSDSKAAWLLLRRPNYISQVQGAPAVFSRRLAATYGERMAAGARALGHADPFNSLTWRGAFEPGRLKADADRLRRFCARPDAPAVLILPFRLAGLHPTPWTPPRRRIRRWLGKDGWQWRRHKRQFVYRCPFPSRAGNDGDARSTPLLPQINAMKETSK